MQPRVVSFKTKSVNAGEQIVLDAADELVSVETISDTRLLLVIKSIHADVSLSRNSDGALVIVAL